MINKEYKVGKQWPLLGGCNNKVVGSARSKTEPERITIGRELYRWLAVVKHNGH